MLWRAWLLGAGSSARSAAAVFRDIGNLQKDAGDVQVPRSEGFAGLSVWQLRVPPLVANPALGQRPSVCRCVGGASGFCEHGTAVSLNSEAVGTELLSRSSRLSPQVPFNAVALRVIHTDVAPTNIMYAVNASWVGLCRIPEEISCQTEGPVLLTQTPVCDCLGFGELLLP